MIVSFLKAIFGRKSHTDEEKFVEYKIYGTKLGQAYEEKLQGVQKLFRDKGGSRQRKAAQDLLLAIRARIDELSEGHQEECEELNDILHRHSEWV